MRPVPTTSVLLALLVPLVQFITRPACAEESAPSWKVHYQRCQALIHEGDYEGALGSCERAWDLSSERGILVHIAQIQTALLHPVQARDALARYLRSGQLEEANRKMAEAQIRYLETLIATLSVTTAVAGAEIRVDDQVIDQAALAHGVQLPAGAHRLTIRANGASSSRFIFLRAGERAEIELPGSGSIALRCATPGVRFFVDDQEVDAAQAARGIPRPPGNHRVTFKAGGATSPEQPVLVNPDERISVVCTPSPPAPSSTVQPASNPRGYWVTGLGMALGVAALATGIYNGNQYDRWEAANESLRSNDLTFAERAEIAQENNHLMDSIQTTRNVALGLGIAGGLVTAGGVALLLVDSAKPAQHGSSSWLRKIAADVSVSGALSSGQIAWRGAW